MLLWAKSKVQIRPHSIKSVRLVLRGLLALREVVDNALHNKLWLNVLSRGGVLPYSNFSPLPISFLSHWPLLYSPCFYFFFN